MSAAADLVLLGVILSNLYVLGTGRVLACVRASAAQGALLAALPLLLHAEGAATPWIHLGATAAGTLTLKAGLIPWLLRRAAREPGARREVEPLVSLPTSVLLGAVLAGFAFWMGRRLPLPMAVSSALLVPVALSTVLCGFLVLVSRRKAVTQVIGYLMLENGVFAFGLCLVNALPFVVELCVLLDVLVGVFVMGITINHISREFDHIETDRLAALRE